MATVLHPPSRFARWRANFQALPRERQAMWTLFFLAPLIAEFIIGSTTLLAFINPVSLFIQTGIYGCTVLFLRELKLRWNAGALSLIFMGATTAIVVEGLGMASLFDPNFPALGYMKLYHQVYGINVAWLLHMAIYHSLQSTFLPILLSQYLFPDVAEKRWLEGKWGKRAILYATGGIIATRALVMGLQYGTHIPVVVVTFPKFLFCATCVGVFLGLGYAVRKVRFSPLRLKPRSASWWAFGAWFAYFICPLGAIKLAQWPEMLVSLAVVPLLWVPLAKLGDHPNRELVYRWTLGTDCFWILFLFALAFHNWWAVFSIAGGVLGLRYLAGKVNTAYTVGTCPTS